MQTTRLNIAALGQTGLALTRVGFGAWAIGGGGYDWQRNRDLAALFQVLERATSHPRTTA